MGITADPNKAKVTGRGMNQKELVGLLVALRDAVLSKPLLDVGSTNTKIKTTNTLLFRVGAGVYTKAATDDIAVLSALGFTDTGVGQFCKLRVEIDADGTFTFTQGGMASAQVMAVPPPRVAGRATVGWIEIPASFVFGTTVVTTAMCIDGDPDLDTPALSA